MFTRGYSPSNRRQEVDADLRFPMTLVAPGPNFNDDRGKADAMSSPALQQKGLNKIEICLVYCLGGADCGDGFLALP